MLRRNFIKLLGLSGLATAANAEMPYLSKTPSNKRKTIWVSMNPQPPFLASYRGYNNKYNSSLNGWEKGSGYDKNVAPHNPKYSDWHHPSMDSNGEITICEPQLHPINISKIDVPKNLEETKNWKVNDRGDYVVDLPLIKVNPPFRPGQTMIDHNGNKSLIVQVYLTNTKNIKLSQIVDEGYHNIDALCEELNITFKQLSDWWVWELYVNDTEHYKFLWKHYNYMFSQTLNPLILE